MRADELLRARDVLRRAGQPLDRCHRSARDEQPGPRGAGDTERGERREHEREAAERPVDLVERRAPSARACPGAICAVITRRWTPVTRSSCRYARSVPGRNREVALGDGQAPASARPR